MLRIALRDFFEGKYVRSFPLYAMVISQLVFSNISLNTLKVVSVENLDKKNELFFSLNSSLPPGI